MVLRNINHIYILLRECQFFKFKKKKKKMQYFIKIKNGVFEDILLTSGQKLCFNSIGRSFLFIYLFFLDCFFRTKLLLAKNPNKCCWHRNTETFSLTSSDCCLTKNFHRVRVLDVDVPSYGGPAVVTHFLRNFHRRTFHVIHFHICMIIIITQNSLNKIYSDKFYLLTNKINYKKIQETKLKMSF